MNGLHFAKKIRPYRSIALQRKLQEKNRITALKAFENTIAKNRSLFEVISLPRTAASKKTDKF